MSENKKYVPIHVRVLTFIDGSDDPEQDRMIDFARHTDRLWLKNHMFWCFYNDRMVECQPI